MTASGFPTLAGVLIPSARGSSLGAICREKNLVRVSNRAEGSPLIMGAAATTVKHQR